MTAAERIANDPRVTAGARIAMFLTPLLVTVGLFILGYWLNGQTVQLSGMETRVTLAEAAQNSSATKIAVLEQTADQTKDNQNATLARLDRMSDGIAALTATVAGLTATIKAQEGRR